MIVAITGHRPNKLNHEWLGQGVVSKLLHESIKNYLMFYKPESFISGLALGSDQIGARAALELEIPVIGAIPCNNQYTRWEEKAKKQYIELVNHPLVKKVYVNTGGYEPWKMTARNQWMVDQLKGQSDRLLAIFDGSSGGTKNCIDYAISMNRTIDYINPKDLI